MENRLRNTGHKTEQLGGRVGGGITHGHMGGGKQKQLLGGQGSLTEGKDNDVITGGCEDLGCGDERVVNQWG